ncbi:hypothetical protein IscW_ISCW013169, partial [Ixodes scapularis]
TPFQRVVIDIVGPPHRLQEKETNTSSPLSTTLRCPDAMESTKISTKHVAEGLVEMFIRTGVPWEVLSDRGSN